MGIDITPGFNLGISDLFGGKSNTRSFNAAASPKSYVELTRAGGTTQKKSSSGNPKSQTEKNNETPIPVGYGGVYSSGGNSDYDPQAALQYDLGINQANDALGRLDRQAQAGLGNLESQYNQGYNSLLGQRAIADRNYDTGRTQQLQDYQAAREGVAANTRNLLMNTRRLLGASGAGGGSADRYAAPQLAQQEGNNQNAVVRKTNTRNLAALDTAYDDDKRNIENSMADLARQRQQGEQSYRSQIEQQRADLLNTIATLSGQRALNNGGSLAQAMAATSPYTSRISSVLNTIDALSASPATLRAQAVQLAAPNLDQYNFSRFDAPALAQQDPGLTPRAYQTLLGTGNDDQRQLQIIQ